MINIDKDIIDYLNKENEKASIDEIEIAKIINRKCSGIVELLLNCEKLNKNLRNTLLKQIIFSLVCAFGDSVDESIINLKEVEQKIIDLEKRSRIDSY